MAVVPIRLHRYSHCYCIHSRTRHYRKLPELSRFLLVHLSFLQSLVIAAEESRNRSLLPRFSGFLVWISTIFSNFYICRFPNFAVDWWLWCLSFLLSKKINPARFLRSTWQHFFFFFCLSIVHRIHRAPGLCLSKALLLSSLRTPAAAPGLSSCTHSWNPKCFSMILPICLGWKNKSSIEHWYAREP